MADEVPQRSIVCHHCDRPIKTTTVANGRYARHKPDTSVLYQPKSNSVEKGMAHTFADLSFFTPLD